MRVLVTAASKHGSTAEVAARIAEALRTALPGDAAVEIRPVVEVADLAPYDAVLLGSAVYMGRWLDDARDAAQRIAAHPPRPVWLFSSGPIGNPPKPDEDPAEVTVLVAALRVADGDFRDWDSIDSWGRQIAAELRLPGAAVTS